jgi:hypothetical protein
MDEPELKIIDVFICKLRKKLANASDGRNFIETVWGRGYVLREPHEEEVRIPPDPFPRRALSGTRLRPDPAANGGVFSFGGRCLAPKTVSPTAPLNRPCGSPEAFSSQFQIIDRFTENPQRVHVVNR